MTAMRPFDPSTDASPNTAADPKGSAPFPPGETTASNSPKVAPNPR